jgi:malate synthase
MDMRVTTATETNARAQVATGMERSSMEHGTEVKYWVDMNTLLTRTAPHSDTARAQVIADLDRLFALQTGSHADVCEYVVYYQQLLAFFADGTSTGLRQPGQLEGLTGSKLNPTSLLLNSGTCQVEMELTQHRERNRGALENLQIEVSAEPASGKVRTCLPALAQWLNAASTDLSSAPAAARNKTFRTVDGASHTTHNRQW